MLGCAGDAMPRNGRKLPTLDDQHAKHLTMVYDMRLKDKPVLRYAYWSPEKDEFVCHGCKNEALTRSIKANCDDPNWRPPGEFYKEGHILAMNLPPPNGQRATSDDENDENNETDQNVLQLNQIVVHQDPQSPGSEASGHTVQLSPARGGQAVSPGEKLSTGKKELLKSVMKSVGNLFKASEQRAVSRDEQNQQRSMEVTRMLGTEFTAAEAERVAAGSERVAAGDERIRQGDERSKAGAARDETKVARDAKLKRLEEERVERVEKEKEELEKEEKELAEKKKKLADKAAKLEKEKLHREQTTDQLAEERHGCLLARP